MSHKEVTATTFHIRCPNAVVKVIYHRGLAAELLAPLLDRLPLTRSFEEACGEIRAVARVTRQTCSIIAEQAGRRAA